MTVNPRDVTSRERLPRRCEFPSGATLGHASSLHSLIACLPGRSMCTASSISVTHAAAILGQLERAVVGGHVIDDGKRDALGANDRHVGLDRSNWQHASAAARNVPNRPLPTLGGCDDGKRAWTTRAGR
jgi:hypothetical protein